MTSFVTRCDSPVFEGIVWLTGVERFYGLRSIMLSPMLPRRNLSSSQHLTSNTSP